MRYLILSDMHGNWEAFSAVLARTRRKRFDATLVLGDLVGYGAAPNQVVEAIRRLPGPVHTVRGNHDKVVAAIEDGANFNEAARRAAIWTRERLTPANLAFVRDLAPGPREIDEGIVVCHGSPLDEDAYIFSNYDAFEVFQNRSTRLTFFGHTHVASAFVETAHGVDLQLLRGPSGTLDLEEGKRYLINPGSIGQPRDRDPRAAYLTFDSARGRVRWHRVAYRIAAAQRRILKAGLPSALAERLSYGI